jgi:hypothetical protein
MSEGRAVSKLDPDIQGKVASGLAEAKSLENYAGNGKKTTKSIKKAINEAGRVRSGVSPSKKEVEVEHRKCEVIYKMLKKEIDPNKKPTTKLEVFWCIKTMQATLTWCLGNIKDLELDKKAKDLGIKFDEKGYVVQDDPEAKEEKKEAKGEKAEKKAAPAKSDNKKSAEKKTAPKKSAPVEKQATA